MCINYQTFLKPTLETSQTFYFVSKILTFQILFFNQYLVNKNTDQRKKSKFVNMQNAKCHKIRRGGGKIPPPVIAKLHLFSFKNSRMVVIGENGSHKLILKSLNITPWFNQRNRLS